MLADLPTVSYFKITHQLDVFTLIIDSSIVCKETSRLLEVACSAYLLVFPLALSICLS